MLTQLSISNYAIAESLEVELHSGMTVVTGETGAGKSIMLDALGLALGDRADAGVVRAGAERAEIHALFDIAAIPEAQRFLSERDLLAGDECVLRRVITSEGRSRGYINGQPATLQDIRRLSGHLIDIHSQHEHQSLLQRDHQRRVLDAFAETGSLSAELAQLAQRHQQTRRELSSLREHSDEQSARSQLLSYQLDELERLAPSETELQELEAEQKQLANAGSIIAAGHQALALCRDDEINAMAVLHQALAALRGSEGAGERQRAAEELLDSALIQIEEAAGELQHHVDSLELDPERLQAVEERLDALYQTARKHRVRPEQLALLQSELQAELDSLSASDERIEQLEQQCEALLAQYNTLAEKLSNKRRKAAKSLCKKVEEQLAALAMANCRFHIELRPRDSELPHPLGREDIEFLVSTNPGSTPGALNRIASGGELSRISLAIQVVTAQVATVPTVVFDEVDVGIGGATAEIVGNLLRTLGRSAQVLCVTHQPQVASKGDHHLKIQKTASRKQVRTDLQALVDGEKIEEIARMLGGIAITEHTLAHAREMLDTRH